MSLIRLYGASGITPSSNGIGTLNDALSCRITEELNGMYELEMDYPVTGKHYADIALGCYIYAMPSQDANYQPFEIYQISRPIGGIITVYAWHYSYKLSSIPVIPTFTGVLKPRDPEYLFTFFEAGVPEIDGESMNNFTFWSDISDTQEFQVSEPESLRSCLGRMQETYGGEFEWDGTTIKLWSHRGLDRGVTINYGKNLVDIKQEESIANTINGIAPYWLGQKDKKTVLVTVDDGIILYQVAPNEEDPGYEDSVYYLALQVIAGEWGNGQARVDALTAAGHNYEEVQSMVNKICYGQVRLWMRTGNSYPRVVPYDMTQFFEEKPTKSQLYEKAVILVQKLRIGIPEVHLDISFVPVSRTREYQGLEVLQSVYLGDTVHVYFEKLGVTAESKVIKTVYNCITDLYDSVELGDSRATFPTTMASVSDRIEASESRTQASYTNAISDAAAAINGANGGYVVIEDDGGHPSQITIMNAQTKEAATHCIRLNHEGIGFSSGPGCYNGNYTSAWTIDGTFDATGINVIHLSATSIDTGILESPSFRTSQGAEGFSINLLDGTITAPCLTITMTNTVQDVLKNDADIENMKNTFTFSSEGLVTQLVDSDGTPSPYNTLVKGDGFYIRENTTDIGHFTSSGLWTNAVSIGSMSSPGELSIPPLVIKPYDTENDGTLDSWIITKI